MFGFSDLIAFVRGDTMTDMEIEIFHFDDGKPSFEDYGKDNGYRYWLASDLMVLLEYASMQPIHNAVNKAMAACAQLGIPIGENLEETRTPTRAKDWTLSRFACYLTVMNGDPKKRRVAVAQEGKSGLRIDGRHALKQPLQ
jgi:DNA-damage-inducible protein D